MFDVAIYESKDGYSELNNQILELSSKAPRSKDARIQLGQIHYSVNLLKEKGTRLPSNIVKHIVGDVWELRPGRNRIMFFYFDKMNGFVLLHMFLKKTQKTPEKEIERAINEMNDYIDRYGGNGDENLGTIN